MSETSIKNQETNYSPNEEQVTAVVSAVSTFTDLGVNPDDRLGMRIIEVDTDGDVYYRTDGADPTSADKIMTAGVYEFGIAEMRVVKFLNVGANVTFIMQPQNFNMIIPS